MTIHYSYYEGHTYGISDTPATWEDARDTALGLGATLAIVGSAGENTHIFDAAQALYTAALGTAGAAPTASDGGGSAYVWLGGSDLANEGTWVWVDGSAISGFANWGAGNGTQEPDDFNGQDALGLAMEGWPAGSGSIGAASEWNDVDETNTLWAAYEWDYMRGTDAGETLRGTDAGNDIRGNAGDDVMVGLDGNDTMAGGAGDDTITTGAGLDIVYGGDGDDVISALGSTGADSLWAGAGEDSVDGSMAGDAIGGGLGADTVYALEGDDVVYGGRDSSSDLINTGIGNDTAFGAGGDDDMGGAEGDDLLFGGGGADRMSGDAGNDTLWGGGGDDSLTGGSGADTFAYVAGAGTDIILDFSLDDGDKLDLTELGITDEADALSNMVQDGNLVVLTAGDVTIQMLDLVVADFEGAADFLV